jgi:hypothetical protein
MMTRLCAAALVVLGLAACGTGGPRITDGSGNPVVFGTHPDPSVGPGSPGWPSYTPSQAGR